MITLGRAGIGAEEVKRGPVRKHHRIAFQLHLHFFGEVDDVLLKDVSLCLTGRKENLVTSGKQGVNQGFTGKIEGRADLARLQQVADAVGFSGFPPVALVVEHGGMEDFFQLLNLLIGENILFRLTAWAFIAVGDVRV